MASDSSHLSADLSVFDRNISCNIDNQNQWIKFPSLSSPSSSPWTSVVRGAEVLTTIDSLKGESSANVDLGKNMFLSSDCSSEIMSDRNSGGGDAAVSKRPPWNKPSNGGSGGGESSSVIGGTASWPALSESTKPTSKDASKSSSDALKTNSDGSTSTSQVPIASETLQRQVNSSVNVNSTPNHGLPRQRSMRRGNGGGSNNGPSGGPPQVGYNRSPPPPPPLPPSFPAIPLLPPYGTFVAPILDTPPPPVRGVRPIGGLRPQSRSDQSSPAQRSPRKNGFSPRPRGDGQHNHNNGGRRDSDRVHNQFIPPVPYIPPPPSPGSASFIAPNIGPFMTPMGYDMTSPYMIVPTLGPEPFRGIPFMSQGPAAPLFYPTADMHLPNMIVKQIDYYFSDENLVRDSYLRLNMDGEGWVTIDLIANFPRVQQMTTDIQMILECLRTSIVVEVNGNKIRRREDWDKWVHKSTRTTAVSGTQPPLAIISPSGLSASIQHMSLNANANTAGSQ